MSSGGRAPGSPTESPGSLTAPQSAQVAPSQGASAPATAPATSSGYHAGLDPLLAAPFGEQPGIEEESDEDVVMEPVQNRALADAIRALAAKLPVNRDAAQVRADEVKAKIDAAASDGAVISAFSRDYQSDIREYLNQYRSEVESLAHARSSLEKLRKHRSKKTYPTSLNSIRIPTIQFSHVFLHSPTEERAMGRYAAPNGNLGQFETTMCAQVVWVKEQILKNWISEKEKEVTFLEGRASAVRAISQFEKVASTRHASLKARYDYLVGQPRYDELVRDVDFEGVCVHSLASTLIAKINGLVIAEEDRKLAAAIKKMELDKPAVEAAAQAPSNELSELKKMVADLGKKVDLSTKKVSDKLYHILCVCAGHLTLTPPLLENLVLTTVEVGREEVERQEQGQGERESRAHRKKGLKGGAIRQSRRQKPGEIQEKRQRQGRRVLDESKVEGQQEERWQEVGASFGLQFRTDSATGSVSSVGKYAFSDVYGLDWDLLVSDCRFLCLSFPPSILLNRRLLPLVQICLVVFSCITAVPKFNILDYSTYPDISTLVEQDLLFLVISRFAPDWLVGSRRFTNRLHNNLDLEIPEKVIGTFSAGLKYISPIAMKKSLVKESWIEFCDRAYRSWDSAHLRLDDSEKDKDSSDPFYLLPIPLKLSGQAKPYDKEPDKHIQSILSAGWTELKSLLGNVPNVDRNNRSVDVESKDALEWCFDNDILVKPTDKNLGTALVSTVWYESKVSAFILNNKGYNLISEDEARTLTTRTVRRVRDLCYNDSTTGAFSGNLSRFLGSRLPPPPQADDGSMLDDDWEALIVNLPIFNGLPKIHKSPWGVRPVIPCHSVVQGPVSEFLSVILKTLLADHPQILTSTKELVHNLETSVRDKLSRLTAPEWRGNVYICTADIEGFYTNVPISDCEAKLEDLVYQHFGDRTRQSRVKADFVKKLFSIQQDDLVFRAKVNGTWEYVRQVDGLAMGMSAAPDIANLYAAWYERRLPVEFTRKMILFKRYIDDIICVVYADSLSQCEQTLGLYNIPGLKLNWEISETNAVFLDLDIWRSPHSRDHRLKYRPYRKPLNNFERLPWCTGHSLQLLRGAFKSEVHRFAVASWSSHIYNEELVWLKDLYISRGYPPATVMNWIKGSKDNAYKNRLDWTFDLEVEESDRIWPLKSIMNPVWQKLNLGMVSDAMHRASAPFIEEERSQVAQVYLRAGLDPHDGDYPFAHKLSKWFGRLVASQKRPINFGDKENRHNRALLGILDKHSKLALAGRSIDQREEDELMTFVPYTLEDYGFTVTSNRRQL
jgi:hypothetical protein